MTLDVPHITLDQNMTGTAREFKALPPGALKRMQGDPKLTTYMEIPPGNPESFVSGYWDAVLMDMVPPGHLLSFWSRPDLVDSNAGVSKRPIRTYSAFAGLGTVVPGDTDGGLSPAELQPWGFIRHVHRGPDIPLVPHRSPVFPTLP